jgi:hypothetical protein
VVCFLLTFQPKPYMHSSSPHAYYIIWLERVRGEWYELWISSLCSFLWPPMTSPLFVTNIISSTLFSDTLRLCFPLNARDQVSHTYKTTGKTIVFVYSHFTFLGSGQEDNSFWTKWQQTVPKFNTVLIPSLIKVWFVTVVPKYLNYSTCPKNLRVLAIFMLWFYPAF